MTGSHDKARGTSLDWKSVLPYKQEALARENLIKFGDLIQ